MKKISLERYFATNAPEQARYLLGLYGVNVESRTIEELVQKLSQLKNENPEAVLQDMANLHPDKPLILRVEEIKKEMNQPEQKSGACGCGSSFGGGSWNADGDNGGGCKCGCGGKCGKSSFSGDAVVQDYSVYGFGGLESIKDNRGTILFGGIALLLAYALYKNS